MLRSKRIEDYFEAKLRDLRAGIPLTFEIYLFFPANRHIMLWKKRGDEPSSDFLLRYRSKGLERIYIHQDDREAYLKYLSPDEAKSEEQKNSEAQAVADAASEAAPVQEEKKEPPQPKTEEGAFIAQVMNSNALTETQKKAVLAEAAQAMMQESMSASNRDEQRKANQKLQGAIEDVLDLTAHLSESAVADVWKLARVDADFEHAVNVATYAVIFAMAFGRIDPQLIADLAMAGLIHDVGISQIPVALATKAWKKMSPPELAEYSAHVSQSISIIDAHEIPIPDRVKVLISQHHEKFDGTGYPRRIDGFKFEDVAQLLSMSDVLDAVSTGHWDGEERTVKTAFHFMESIEKARTFPEHFNPDVFAVVLKWLKSAADQNTVGHAAKVVGKQARQVIESDKK